MSQCTTATITTPNSSAFVTSSSLKIVDRMPKNDKNGDRMPKGDKNGGRMPKRDKAESSRAPKNATIENRTPKNETIENITPKNEPNLEVAPGNELTGSNRMPKVYYHNRIKRAASNGPNGMPNEKVPFADLDKMPNCSSEYQHNGTVSSEFSVSMASPMPSLAPSSSSSSSVVASSDSFSTIRRNCERHMRRLERYKKARSFCSLDTAEAEEEEAEEDNKRGNNAKPTPTAEGGNDQHKADDQQHQEEQILRQTADKKTGTGGEQFETLRSKMLSLMENDMHLLAKLLQLGETLCELRSKHEQQQQQHQQQQNPLKYCDGYGEGGGGQTASISSPNWALQRAAEHDDSDGDVHDDEDAQQQQIQQKQKNAFLDDEEADVIGDASAPRSLLHRARQHRRRAPLPPEFGRASAATVTRVYLAGEQQANDANRRRGVPLGGAVRSDQEDNDEEGEEDDDQISPNVQYFSRKNSVLRIPIPPRASNRNFGRPKFHQRLNSSNFSSSSPSCCAGAAAGSSPLVMMAAHTKMLSSAAPSPSHCAAAASAAHHHHNGTAPPPPPPPSTIVETDLLMMDSGHSSASSEADPQQHSPPGAPSSRFSTFSSSLSTGSASCRSLFGVAALAEAAKRTKSEERRADGSRGGSAAERCAGVAETERAVLDGWKTNCNVKNNKSSFSD